MKRIILFVLVALFAMPTASAQSPLELFQQALRLESVQGDLEGAIALYERVGSSFGSDRALGARALFRMGQAYETLGQNDATRAYRRIVSEFADQAETVAMAEAALGRLVMPPEVLSTPESLLGPALPFIGDGSSLSRDGKYAVFTDWSTSRLGYIKLGDSQVHWVTPTATQENGWPYAFWGRFSPDNSEIAYAWHSGIDSSSAIRVFNRLSGETREIVNDRIRFGRRPNEGHSGVYDWTSDGSHILVELWPAPTTVHLALIDRDTGSESHYVELNRLSGMPACLLEDRYVLFDDDTGGMDRVLRADLHEGSVQPFLTGGTESQLLGCSNEKQAAVVTSNEFGSFQAWLYRLDSGKPSGVGRHLEELAEGAISAGGLISDNGRLLYQRDRSEVSTGLYRFDGDSITERIEALPSVRNWGGGGSFSPDGNQILFHTDWNLLSVRGEDGETRNITLPRRYFRVRWLADGSGLVANWSDGGTPFATRIDLESGLPGDTLSGPAAPGRSGANVMQAHRRDAETVCINEFAGGQETRQLVVCYPDARASGGFWPLVETGSQVISVLAWTTGSEKATTGWYRTLVDVQTGEATVVSEPERWGFSWQPSLDNEGMLLDSSEGSIYRTPRDGSDRKKLFTRYGELREIVSYSLHPTDSLILITSRPRRGPGSVKGSPDRVGLLEGLWDRFD